MASITGKRKYSNDQVKAKRKRPADYAKSITKTVALDSLPWNEVQLPDRLEDAEGFFGLEEVEDVDIVKDPTTGSLEYRVGKHSTPAKSMRLVR